MQLIIFNLNPYISQNLKFGELEGISYFYYHKLSPECFFSNLLIKNVILINDISCLLDYHIELTIWSDLIINWNFHFIKFLLLSLFSNNWRQPNQYSYSKLIPWYSLISKLQYDFVFLDILQQSRCLVCFFPYLSDY